MVVGAFIVVNVTSKSSVLVHVAEAAPGRRRAERDEQLEGSGREGRWGAFAAVIATHSRGSWLGA